MSVIGGKRKMKKISLAVRFAVVLLGVLLLIGLGIQSSKTTPDHAIVHVNDASKTYSAPLCTQTKGKLRIATAAQARKMGYSPDPECRDQGWFVQDDRSLTGMLLQKIGFLKPLPSRWNKDGSWNY